MTERNEKVIEHYKSGASIRACAMQDGRSHQRIRQILRAAGVWRKPVPGSRPEFLGVDVSTETKEALRTKADELGISVSRLTSDTLETMLGGQK